MNQTDPGTGAEAETTDDTARTGARRGREYVSKAASSLRRGVESGTVTATIGGAGLLSGVRAFLAGKRTMGLARAGLGVGFLTAAAVQRRSHNHGEEPDDESIAGEAFLADEEDHTAEEDHAAGEATVAVSDTSPVIEDAESGFEFGADTDAESASIDQREIADNSVDSEDLAETVERETGDTDGEDETSEEATDEDETSEEATDEDGTGEEATDEDGTGDETTGEDGTSNEATAEVDTDVGDGTETEEFDRLGEAAFNSQSREVPAPQRAFNQDFLAHSSMVCWGIRARDGAVLIAQDYDVIAGRDGVKYVASSEIGTDVREVPIPDAILTHWDEMIRSGMAVTGGDDILFVTTESLEIDGLLRVLPSEWADDL